MWMVTLDKRGESIRRAIEVLLVLLMIGGPIALAQADDAGQAVYQRHCASCHGQDGKGDGPAASTLPAKPTDFTNKKFWSDDVHKKIQDAVINGHKSMPAIKMSENDIKAVTDYISNTFKQ